MFFNKFSQCILFFGVSLGTVVMSAAETYEADVIVYGGTSAAVMSGVQAKRSGKSVIIVSPDKHLGGLTSGGLGWTDNGHAKGIGGIAREFYIDIKKHYEKPEAWRQQTHEEYKANPRSASRNRPTDECMWVFEPHVAEGLMDRYVSDHEIKVHREAYLDRAKGVVKDGAKIVSITTLGGDVYRGKVFIDGTYEGDLMAASGVDFHVGRESSKVYDESVGGVQRDRRDHGHYFSFTGKKIDPYVVPGDPSSGLLARISDQPPGENGDGDHKIQAYCFRACLTDVPENRVPFTKPEGYDPDQYLLMLRVLDSGWREVFNKFDPMPNRKTDQNNHGPFSMDNIGYNYDYPEASYERRREIIKEHETYQKGLMYFMANDLRVPDDVREPMSKWGLAKDEFMDNGNWSHQLYIREARRMVGEYVMTQHDVEGKTDVKDSIGLGVYTMDSHNAQRYVTPDGGVENEGNVGKRIRHPYPIAMGVVLPKKAQASNLLVPAAASASHIAYGSLRMEPTFMTLGQSSGLIASIAIDQGIAVQDVKYEEDLKPLLVEVKQRLVNPPKVKKN